MHPGGYSACKCVSVCVRLSYAVAQTDERSFTPWLGTCMDGHCVSQKNLESARRPGAVTLLFILGRARLSYCASLSAAPVLLLPAHPILRDMQLWAHATMIVLASAGEHCVAQTLGLLSE